MALSKYDFYLLLQPGQILFFRNPSFPATAHPHICLLESTGEIILLSSATSQQNTVERFVRYRQLPMNTVVFVNPNNENGLSKDTYINCNNEPFEFAKNDLWKWYSRGQLTVAGVLSPSDLEQIVLGLLDSPLIAGETQDLVRLLLSRPPLG